MVLAKAQTSRSMEKNREPRQKPTQIQSNDLWQRREGNKMEGGYCFQQMLLEQLDIHTHIKEPKCRPNTLHKNELKMDHRLKRKAKLSHF